MSIDALLDNAKKALPKIQGWCSPEKAEMLIRLIVNNKLTALIEIGVFGGSSLIPQAMALKYNDAGKIYGIDPWTKDAALEHMFDNANKEWWGSLDLRKIYEHCCTNIALYGLDQFVALLPDKAENVVDQFADGSIDLLHIDGNHSEELSYKDATLYLPKVRSGGFVAFDDVWWTDGHDDPTTRKAIMFLGDHCDRIELVGDCMIFKKR